MLYLRRELQKFAEKHEICDERDLSGMIDFVLPYHSYNVEKNGKDDHVEYDVIDSNDMNDMPRFLEGVTKPVRHRHMFCISLQSALCFKSLASEQRKNELVPGKILASLGLRARRAKM